MSECKDHSTKHHVSFQPMTLLILYNITYQNLPSICQPGPAFGVDLTNICSTADIFCHGSEDRDGTSDTVGGLVNGGIGRRRGSSLCNHSSITHTFGHLISSCFAVGRERGGGSCHRGGPLVSVCWTILITLGEQLYVYVCICNKLATYRIIGYGTYMYA